MGFDLKGRPNKNSSVQQVGVWVFIFFDFVLVLS